MLRPSNSADSLIDQKTHRLATLWAMRRKDNRRFYFTDHDTSILFEGNVYMPAGGTVASATRLTDGLESQNFEVNGAITSEEITIQDLRNGLWRDTEVTEYTVDWGYPFAGPLVVAKYSLSESTWSDEVFSFQIEGASRGLKNRQGRVLTKNCRHTLGAGFIKNINCTVNLGSVSFAGVDIVSKVSDMDFTVSTSQVPANTTRNRLRFGKVVWITGSNAGFEQEIKDYSNNVVTTFLSTPNPIDVVNDKADIFAGCDKIRATCITEYNNLKDFGGFPFTPGAGKLLLRAAR